MKGWQKTIKIFFISAFIYAQIVHSAPNTTVDLSATTDETSVYVNAQVVLTVLLKVAAPMRSGSLAKPEIKNAVIETLLEDEQQEVIEDGITKQLFKRSYAIFPEKPGTLIIPSISFEGVLIAERGDGFFPGFFSQGRKVKLGSKAISIEVKDIPKNYPAGEPFLPLKSFSISEAFAEEKPKFEVNKAATRRFEIKAVACLPSLLRPLKAPKVDGVQIYSDTGQKLQNTSDEGLVVDFSYSHVFLPTKPGDFHVPKQNIYWWDTVHDQLKTAEIKGFDMVVEGEALPSSAPPTTDNKVPAEKTVTPEEKPISRINYWIWVSGLLFILWIATLALYISSLRRKTTQAKEAKTPKKTQREIYLVALKDACQQKSIKEALNALMILVQIDPNLSVALRDCLTLLEHARYHHQIHSSGDELWSQLTNALRALENQKQNKNTLKPLYPK